MKKQTLIGIILSGVALFLIVAVIVARYVTGQNNQVACTQEAMVCPDGSAVGRVGPRCEFAPCPTAGAPDNSLPNGEVVQYRTIAITSGVGMGAKDASNFTVISQSEYNNLKTTLTGSPDLKIDLPEVDFSKEMVIAVLQGQRNTGGYSIEVTNVIKESKKLYVIVETTDPGPSCINTQVITSPYHLVAVPKGDYQVEFRTTPKVFDCN
jgi:hypothetical protein